MPSNSQYKINNFSPNFRDALLLRNLVTDTVKNNSLSSWLDGINKPADIGDGIGKVKGSEDIEVSGPAFRNNNIRFNKIKTVDYYKKINIPFNKVDLIFPNSSYNEFSTSPISSPTNDSEFWRDTQNTLYNPFTLGGPQYYNKNIIEYKTVNITTNTELIDKNIKKNPEDAGVFRRQLNITQNKYKGNENEYERISLKLLPFETNPALGSVNTSSNVYTPSLESYTQNKVPANGTFQGGNIRKFVTSKNIYLDVAKQTRVDLKTEPMTTVQYTSYLDEFGSSKAIQLGNALGAILTGDGIGFDPNTGAIRPDFDIRSSLAGRALTSAGLLKDTKLGQISPQYLAAAIGNNIAFNLQEETIGRINTNPLSLLMGNNLIVPNYKLTVRSGVGGTAADIIERITGAKVPVSLLPEGADIFSFNSKGPNKIGNIQRANLMIKNTGTGTVGLLYANINANVNPGFLGNRQGYAPGFDDFKGNQINKWNLYAYESGVGEGDEFRGDGKVLDILNQSELNTPIAQSSYRLDGIVSNSGFNDGPKNLLDNSFIRSVSEGEKDSRFIWSDTKFNKLPRNGDDLLNGIDFKEKKSILYKTQQLFNSGRMRTLVSGKGIKANSDETTTVTSPTGSLSGYMSKGSGVLKYGGRTSSDNPDEIFARAWSPVDKYDQYKDLQKHSRLSKEGRFDNVDVESSVLGEHGIVQIGPYSDKSGISNFMFSIENLAWADSLTKLLPCEIGPGDLLTGKKGRIMWFPPYDITFNESVSVNWDKTNFIGRGEPIYTYNNTERTGTLGFKIVVDHPNYLNYMKDISNNEIAAFFAGALSIPQIRDKVLSEEEKAKYALYEKNKEPGAESPKQQRPKFEFSVYYKNDVSEVPLDDYENGLSVDYELYPNGIKYTEDGTSMVEWYGLTATQGEGIVGLAGKTYPDYTNFGLNGKKSPIQLEDGPGGTQKLNGWNELRSSQFTDYFINGNCKYCKITITGYASEQGGGDNTKNKELAKQRGEKLKEHFKTLFINNGVSEADVNKRLIINGPDVRTGRGCTANVSPDSYECKQDRVVTVKVQYDYNLEKADDPEIAKREDRNEPVTLPRIPWSRFYTECDYFESISKDTDSFYYKELKQKLKHFHPAFHAITPEGFNSRLTFLHQCTRQGDTSGANVDNLAFGRPPVCILRLGDFYHTKIIIDSLTIDYEPLVWDLNPEGVGVQPMIANVNISFAFIGGSSMKGPINRLQNAVSFNFFANTELYDPRAERIEKLEKPNKDGKTAVIVPGKFPYPQYIVDRLEKELKDAQDMAEFEAKKQAQKTADLANMSAQDKKLAALENDKLILANTKINAWFNYTDFKLFDLEIIIAKKDTNITGSTLSTEYIGTLYIEDSSNNKQYLIGAMVMKSEEQTGNTITVLGNSFDGSEWDLTLDISNGDVTGIINFKLDEHPDYQNIMDLLNPCEKVEKIIFNDIQTEKRTPCENGNHTLIMEWKDNDGQPYCSTVEYVNSKNGFQGT